MSSNRHASKRKDTALFNDKAAVAMQSKHFIHYENLIKLGNQNWSI
ncbi:hypothetical protein [Oligella urethralis]|nr:hypothetical protein [Oligella urethralis]